MPIRPIDLQTLLMQLGHVGREQAIEKDGAVLQSSIQGAAALKRQGESKEAVRGPEGAEEGLRPVADRQGAGPGGGKPQGERNEAEEEKPRDEVVRDPELGTKVDLSG